MRRLHSCRLEPSNRKESLPRDLLGLTKTLERDGVVIAPGGPPRYHCGHRGKTPCSATTVWPRMRGGVGGGFGRASSDHFEHSRPLPKHRCHDCLIDLRGKHGSGWRG